MEEKTEEWLQENYTDAADNLFREPVFANALGVTELSLKTLNKALTELDKSTIGTHTRITCQAQLIAYVELKSNEYYRSGNTYLDIFEGLVRDEETIEGRIQKLIVENQNLPEYMLFENAIKGVLMTSYTAKYGDMESRVEKKFAELFPQKPEARSTISQFSIFHSKDEVVEELPENHKKPGA